MPKEILKKWLLVYLIIVAQQSFAGDITALFPKGNGSQFIIQFPDNVSAELLISIADSTHNQIAVEYYMKTAGGIVLPALWQQYILQIRDGQKLALVDGYVYTVNLGQPQRIPGLFFQQIAGIKVTDFLLSSDSELKAWLVGEELVKIPAGMTRANHYRKSSGDQTVDFWISEAAKPIGLVRMTSRSPGQRQKNYTITLQSLAKNVKATIDPVQAIPLNDAGKALLNLGALDNRNSDQLVPFF